MTGTDDALTPACAVITEAHRNHLRPRPEEMMAPRRIVTEQRSTWMRACPLSCDPKITSHQCAVEVIDRFPAMASGRHAAETSAAQIAGN